MSFDLINEVFRLCERLINRPVKYLVPTMSGLVGLTEIFFPALKSAGYDSGWNVPIALITVYGGACFVALRWAAACHRLNVTPGMLGAVFSVWVAFLAVIIRFDFADSVITWDRKLFVTAFGFTAEIVLVGGVRRVFR
jgi:hypothetical protein